MKQMLKLLPKSGVLVCGILLWPILVDAHPWLAQRYSQNCAACHAPGRVNKPLKDKRFSLSCDSCHENPNGGGLRNHYGKWLEEKWLKSHQVKGWILGERPSAPVNFQHYASKYPRKVRPKKVRRSRLKNRPYPEVKVNKDFDEKFYGTRVDRAHKATTSKEKLFEVYIPKEDPYYKSKGRHINIGGDLRYFLLSSKFAETSSSDSYLSADVGLSLKAWNDPDIKAVFEYRYFSDSEVSLWPESDNNEGFIRSAYLKLDDMVYNTYFMAGLYRPMFGLYDSNYFSLRESMLFNTAGGSHQLVYEGLSFGGSPNGAKPYFNLNLLTNATDTGDESSGYVLNFGYRSEAGWHALMSYWLTKKDVGVAKDMEKQMLSVSGGFKHKKWIANFETVFFEEETNPSLPIRHKGYISNIDLKRKLWKEYYLDLSAAWTNTARDLSEGRGNEFGAGIKAYLLPGIEVEANYVLGTEKRINTSGLGISNDYSRFLLQTHMFW